MTNFKYGSITVRLNVNARFEVWTIVKRNRAATR